MKSSQTPGDSATAGGDAAAQSEVVEKKIRDEINKNSNRLVLENQKLQDLSFMSGLLWESLSEIDLHKNYLSSIDVLNQFRNLKTITAADNYIEQINLNL